MKRISIEPWPFPVGESLKLLWVGSPYRVKDEVGIRWQINAFFQRKDNKIISLPFSFELLPYMKIGQYYCNGSTDESKQYDDSFSKVTISESVDGCICNADNIPRNLYPLNKKELFTEKVWRFHVNGRVYFVPCIEILRCYLARTATLASCITSFDGLTPLFNKIVFDDKKLDVELSSGVIHTDSETIYHLLWLRFNSIARKAWRNVFQRVQSGYGFTVMNSDDILGTVQSFDLVPPIDGNHSWIYRGVDYKNVTLILEIKKVYGGNLDYDEITCSHHAFSDKKRIVLKREPNDDDTDQGEGEPTLEVKPHSRKRGTNPEVYPTQLPSFQLVNPPKLKRVPSRITKERIFDESEDDKDPKPRPPKSINTNKDSTNKLQVSSKFNQFGGDLKPLEFRKLQVTDVTYGLESFLDAVQGLEEQGLKLDLKIVYLPEGKTFSTIDGSLRRTCAIVHTKDALGKTCLILELARPDDWQVSTLFVWSNILLNEGAIISLLDSLLQHAGHWDRDDLGGLTGLTCEPFRHGKDPDPNRWAERLGEKLGYIMYLT